MLRICRKPVVKKVREMTAAKNSTQSIQKKIMVKNNRKNNHVMTIVAHIVPPAIAL